MRRFELGMSINYASNWGVVEAVREFFQNAIDEEKENPENKMIWGYENNILTIKNKKSKLTPKSLLLGASSKSDNENLIGQHGEGYKVATVVLERNGVKVRIYNNEAKEIWESKVVRSKRYDADIVVFDIEKKVFQSDCDLVIELEGITPEMYKRIVKSNLHLQDNIGETKESLKGYGRVLLGSKYKGNIYVEGLYVCSKPQLNFGYDFAANKVKLDRDRGLIDSFDLLFTISELVNSLQDADFISSNIKLYDLSYIYNYMYTTSDSAVTASDNVYEDFKQEYGEDAIPTSSTVEFNRYKALGGNPIMVDNQVKRVIDVVPRDYKSNVKMTDIDREFQEWLDRAEDYVPRFLLDELIQLWGKRGNTNESHNEEVQAE